MWKQIVGIFGLTSICILRESLIKMFKKFIDYMLGSKVQNDLVPKLGYISINKMQVERDSNNHVVQKNKE